MYDGDDISQAEGLQKNLRLVKENSMSERKTWNSRFKSEGDIFQMFCPVMWLPAWAVTRMRVGVAQTLNAEKWFPCMICVSNIPPAFLAHFLSDILLLTIFVTGWLRPPVWCEDAPEEKGDQDKITSASKKLNLLSTVQSWAGEKSLFSKAATLGGVRPILITQMMTKYFSAKIGASIYCFAD